MTNEKRLIDANALDEKCRRQMADEWNKRVAPVSWAEAYKEFLDDIWDAPTVDAVEVVRCKDCKHYVDAPYYVEHEIGQKICRSPNLDYDTECGDQWMWMNPDDFCSCGERKDEECPLGGDTANDCADCFYSADYHFKDGECVRR